MLNIKDELRVIGREPLFGSVEGQVRYNTPITGRENFMRFVRHEKPMWLPGVGDIINIMPLFIPEVGLRGIVADTLPFDPMKDAGGQDMFGIEWVFVPEVGGSTVRPGNPMIEDITRWKETIKAPDITKWAWAEASERLKPYYLSSRANKTTIYTGLFERLISFMDFANAAVALIDDDQQPYVHEIFNMLVDVYEKMLEYLRRYLNIDVVCFHDDWGSQRAPFFSLHTCMEMIIPYLKRITDKAHSLGMVVDFHCCGMNEPLIPAMIAAGVDLWSGQSLNNWDRVADTYGNKIIWNIVWAIYNSNEFTSKDEFIRQAFEQWEHYYHCPGAWMTIGRHYSPDLAGKLFEMTYPISRSRMAAEL